MRGNYIIFSIAVSQKEVQEVFKLSSPLLSIINTVGKNVCMPTTKYRTQQPTPTIIIIIPHNCRPDCMNYAIFEDSVG